MDVFYALKVDDSVYCTEQSCPIISRNFCAKWIEQGLVFVARSSLIYASDIFTLNEVGRDIFAIDPKIFDSLLSRKPYA